MKVNNPSLKLIWDDLEKIFLDYRGMNSKVTRSLQSLGFKIVNRNHHIKLLMDVDGKKLTLVFSSTPSDLMVGKQILRDIRRYYDGGELK